MLRFRAFGFHFFGTFLNFILLFLILLYFLGLLGFLRCFVTNQICHNLRTFLGKIFFGSKNVCIKKLSLYMSANCFGVGLCTIRRGGDVHQMRG